MDVNAGILQTFLNEDVTSLFPKYMLLILFVDLYVLKMRVIP